MLASVFPSAQQPTPATGVIACSVCPLSGQQASATAFDGSKLKFIAQIRPAFHEGETWEVQIIARVLLTSPMTLETLDSRFRTVARGQRPGPEIESGDGPSCRGLIEMEAVDLASKSTAAGLRFNDIISGTIVMQRDETMPDAILAATQVLTDIRKVSGSPTYFHASPSPRCDNRSGQLVEYRGLANDALTIYNDGAIHYRDPLLRRFHRERLSQEELSELLGSFAAVKFDALADAVRPLEWSNLPGIMLTANRLQDVWLSGNEERLAPLVQRLVALTTRAMSNTYFLLKTNRRRDVVIEAWSYDSIKLDGFRGNRHKAYLAREGGADVSGHGAFAERLPEEFLGRLPTAFQGGASDNPAPPVYFSQAGKLFRVAYNRACQPTSIYCGTFYSLDVTEMQTIASALRSDAARTYVSGSYASAGRPAQGGTIDPARIAEYGRPLSRPGPYLWTSEVGTRLADVPSSGVRIAPSDYERHKALYFALLLTGETGLDLIEDGVLFEHVRVCQMEPGVVDECIVK